LENRNPEVPNYPEAYERSKHQFDCKYGYYVFFNEATGEIIEYDCHSWKCPRHAPMVFWRWHKRLQMVKWDLFLTITQVPEDKDTAAVAWTAFIRVLRAKHGIHTYIRCMELGPKGGMRHYHVLLAGTLYIEKPFLSALAERCGFGYIVDIKHITYDGGIIPYVLKYVLKEVGYDDPRTHNWRRVSVSRNIPSWGKYLSRLRPLDDDEVPPGCGPDGIAPRPWVLISGAKLGMFAPPRPLEVGNKPPRERPSD